MLRQERGRELGTGFQQVLAVVEDEQGSFLGEGGDHLLDGCEPGQLMRSHRGQHRRSDARLVGDAREFHEPDPARELLGKLGRHRQGEPCLAHPS